MTANTSAASSSVNYWNGTTWTTVSGLDDTTDTVATKTLSGTGSITFTSTVTTAKPKMYNNIYAYWYQFIFDGIDATTSVYYVTLDAPMQQIVDLWDGVQRPVMSVMLRKSNKYKDRTSNVLEQDFLRGAIEAQQKQTYLDLSSLTGGVTPTQWINVGFAERITGIEFVLVTDKEQTATKTMNIDYGIGMTWTSV